MKRHPGFIKLMLLPAFVLLSPVSHAPGDISIAHSYKDMVFVKGGTFPMGSDSNRIRQLCKTYGLPFDYLSPEIPVHTVTLSSFYMDKFEVTNAGFKNFIDQNPLWQKGTIPDSLHNGDYLKNWTGNDYPAGQGNLPVNYVSWFAAMAYAKWMGKRLPREAEWEYAAAGGKKDNEYPWGSDLVDSSYANYGNKIKHLTEGGTYSPNPYGIYDLAGNVWEYCVDEWDEKYYAKSPRYNPVSGNIPQGNFLLVKTRRVIRGGSYEGGAVNLRVRFRDSHPVSGAGNHVGFRCVADP